MIDDEAILEAFSDVLERTNALCDPARFCLMLEIFTQMDSPNIRKAALAGFRTYVEAEQENIARQKVTH